MGGVPRHLAQRIAGSCDNNSILRKNSVSGGTMFVNTQEKGGEPRVTAIRLPGDYIGPNPKPICKSRVFRSEKPPHVIEWPRATAQVEMGPQATVEVLLCAFDGRGHVKSLGESAGDRG